MSRILLINYEYPPLGGGAGNATAHIARHMAEAGAEVLVVTSTFKDLPREESVDGYRLRRIPSLRARAEKSNPLEMAAFMLSACLAAPGLMRRFRPHAAVAFFSVPCGPSALALRLLCGTPYVVSLRGGDVPGFQPYDLATFHKLTGWLIRLVWRRASAVVANSQGLADLARKTAASLDVPVIPNGADTDLFRPRTGPRRQGPVRLGFSGRVVRQKGLDVALRALALLPATPAWELHVAGDGPARPELEATARALGLAERIKFLGWKSRTELAEILRDMDAFVFASRDEGMPNAVLEAMASGLPVAATRIAGNEELVLDAVTGFLTPPESPGDLALALGTLIGSENVRQTMGAAARARVEAHYSWRETAKSYLALCQGLK